MTWLIVLILFLILCACGWKNFGDWEGFGCLGWLALLGIIALVVWLVWVQSVS